MDYFVSIDNTPYERWQIELLIESFKMHKLQDYLCIAVAENNTTQYADYTKNLKNHKRKIQHNNFQEKNNLYSLIACLENNIIRQPFVLLKPHMILYKPVEEGPDTIICNVIDDVSPEIKIELQNKLPQAHKIPYPGDLLIFKNCPTRFFHKIAMKIGENIHEELAWLLTMQEYYDFITYGTGQIEMPMIYGGMDMPIINYKHGYPSKFQRMHYQFNKALQLGSDPIEDLLRINLTPPPTEYMQEVAKNYKKNK